MTRDKAKAVIKFLEDFKPEIEKGDFKTIFERVPFCRDMSIEIHDILDLIIDSGIAVDPTDLTNIFLESVTLSIDKIAKGLNYYWNTFLKNNMEFFNLVRQYDVSRQESTLNKMLDFVTQYCNAPPPNIGLRHVLRNGLYR